MGAERQKGKFLIFRFWRCQVLGMKSLTCRFLNEIETSKHAIKLRWKCRRQSLERI